MKRREFPSVLGIAATWIAAALLLIGGVLHNSPAQAEDKAYAKIGWWQINYREFEDVNGCYAAASFQGQTLIGLALVQMEKGKAWLIFISNPGWNSWVKRKEICDD
jgi:hypothetical protein